MPALLLRAMFMYSRKRLVAALILLPVVLFIGSNLINSLQGTVASKSQEVQPSKQPSPIQRPPAIAKQLESEGVTPPVELQRPAARLSAANQLEEYTCIVKNNTEKAVVAFSLAWTIVIEVAGKESAVTELEVMDSLIHPDFRESGSLRPVSPGTEFVAESGPTYFGSNDSIKRVKVSIDYVEFEDGTSLGPNINSRSSQQIAVVREGTARYKEWLVQTYVETGRSLKLVLQKLLNELIPDDLNLSTAEMKQGAHTYRRRMLDLYKKQRADRYRKILQQMK